MPTMPGRAIVMPIVAETMTKGGIALPGVAQDDKFRLKRGVIEESGLLTSKAGDFQPEQPPNFPLPAGTLILYNSMTPFDHEKSVAIELYNVVRYFIPDNITEFPGFEEITPQAWVAKCKSVPRWFTGFGK